MRLLHRRRGALWSACFAAAAVSASTSLGADAPLPFPGSPTTWHDGFARYDYLMDEHTRAIVPFTVPPDEHFAVKAPPSGFRRCVVVLPKTAVAGNPWSWRSCYWDHQPQTEVALLHRGFAIAFITPDPDSTWDAWYAFLIQHGLSKRPAFVGMSKGGVNAYDWAATHPEQVSCIYADNPAIRPASFEKLDALAAHDVPLLNVVGSEDFLLQHHTLPIENRYHQLGGRITLMMKLGTAHHPHSLTDPTLIADWIENNSHPSNDDPPLGDQPLVKSYYYSLENTYRFLPADGVYAICRGPGFTPCYCRYDLTTASPWNVTGMAVIAPLAPAAGMPWVFRANAIDRNAAVDQLLLAKGYHIVIAPLTEQIGPTAAQWDAVYHLMTAHGFSARPVLEGTTAGAGEAIAWASMNTDKVAAVYIERPILRSLMSKQTPTASLASLATTSVPLIVATSEQDPWHGDADLAQSVYAQDHQNASMITVAGMGADPLSAADAERVVARITDSRNDQRSDPLSR